MAVKQEMRTIMTPQGELTYQLTRKAVKNVNLRIDRSGRVKVSAAHRVPVSFIDDFIKRKQEFIYKAITNVQQNRQNRSAEVRWTSGSRLNFLGQAYTIILLEGKKEEIIPEFPYLYFTTKPETTDAGKEVIWQNWQKRRAKEILEDSLKRMEEKVAPYGITYSEWCLRRMTSRWGSCQPARGKITLNTRLVEAPIKAIDYVVLHELAHMKYPHHQREFYNFIARFMPDWKERKDMLKGIL